MRTGDDEERPGGVYNSLLEQQRDAAMKHPSPPFTIEARMGSYMWLSDAKYWLPQPDNGSIVFEAKAENDICICMHHVMSDGLVGRDGLPDSPAYEVLIGGWANNKTAVRKFGDVKASVTKDEARGAVIENAHQWRRYRVVLQCGAISIYLEPVGGRRKRLLAWSDPMPVRGMRYVGVSSWNNVVQFRNMHVSECRRTPSLPYTNGDMMVNEAHLCDVVFSFDCTREQVHAHRILLCGALRNTTLKWSHSSVEGSDTAQGRGAEEAQIIPDRWSPDADPLQVHLHGVNPSVFVMLLEAMYTRNIRLPLSKLEGAFTLARDLRMEESLKSVELTRNKSSTMLKGSLPRLHCMPIRDRYPNATADVVFAFSEAAQTTRVRAHKAVLALWSRPFYAMFTNQMRESSQGEIELPDVTCAVFRKVKKFCYSNVAEIEPRDAVDVLLAADRFSIAPLVTECLEYVGKHIDVDNVCMLMSMATHYKWEGLQMQCIEFIESNFEVVAGGSAFFEFDVECLVRVLANDHVLVSDESVVLDAAERWIEHHCGTSEATAVDDRGKVSSEAGTAERKKVALWELLSTFIRLPLMSTDALDQIKRNDTICASKSSYTQALLDEAVQSARERSDIDGVAHSMRLTGSMLSEGAAATNFRLRRRTGSDFIPLQFGYAGDRNGVCSHVGTQYGKGQWRNPHTAGLLHVTMSSPVCRYTRPEVVVGRTFKSTNYATGRPASCCIDLREGHSLICNYYTLRGDGSPEQARNWELQGRSEEQSEWVRLRTHENDDSLMSGAYGGWPVYGESAQRQYRYFRVVVQGERLAISHFELYGYFL